MFSDDWVVICYQDAQNSTLWRDLPTCRRHISKVSQKCFPGLYSFRGIDRRLIAEMAKHSSPHHGAVFPLPASRFLRRTLSTAIEASPSDDTLKFPSQSGDQTGQRFYAGGPPVTILALQKAIDTQRVRFQNSCNVPPTVFKLSVCLELAMATELKNLPPCSVCNKPVCLESATTDEQGRIVHDKCYFLKIISAKPTPTNREQFGKSGSRD
jgi:hypothetical protein